MESIPEPNTFLLGGQKCGSTWLASRLGQHPQVFMAAEEIHFFDKDYNYCKGLDWYSNFFLGASGQRIIAEKTPEYLWAEGIGGKGVHSHSPEVHLRMRKHFPEARFVVVLRDPVRRALSALNHMRSNGYFSPAYSDETVLFGSKKRIGSAFGLLEKGIYAEMLQAYFSVFPREQFLVVGFEKGVCDAPRKTLAEVCAFLGIADTDFTGLEERENEVRASSLGMWLRYLCPRLKRTAHFLDSRLPAREVKASAPLRERLAAFYRPHNDRLFDLLQMGFEGWS